MGLLTTVLGCEISWGTQGLEVLHPQWGRLEVTVEDGCPVVSQEVAMKLIQQIESKAKHMAQILKMDTSSEAMWLRRLVEEHPAFQGVPDEIKSQLGTSR
jgi:RAB protein geranylgeranyltransferase component A